MYDGDDDTEMYPQKMFGWKNPGFWVIVNSQLSKMMKKDFC